MTLAILFAIAGIAQIFYAASIVLRWGRAWYYAGIIGTANLIILGIETRIPSGRVLGEYAELLPINVVGIAVLIFQFAALLLSIRILQTSTIASKKIKAADSKGKSYPSDSDSATEAISLTLII